MTGSGFANPSDEEIAALLRSARTIAVVGASSKTHRPSYRIFAYLQDAGYRVLPVNPNETEVQGVAAYASLDEIEEPVDLVDVFRRAEETADVAKSAVGAGSKALWLQLGIANGEAARIAGDAGLQVVMDRCIAVEHSRLGVGKR